MKYYIIEKREHQGAFYHAVVEDRVLGRPREFATDQEASAYAAERSHHVDMRDFEVISLSGHSERARFAAVRSYARAFNVKPANREAAQ